ncbi:hypothetical protein B0T16DRAFT_462807 [Cercophora newfieldiana]|uniref:Uncharacterized protein n=1 Tax=Cercophora newfieldiana TaxID=92897 RepID=A0AA39XTG6_9PEZI|nr:hypothetical protein B0T16DRAFT_462807 [Cercophora newfieldiana]
MAPQMPTVESESAAAAAAVDITKMSCEDMRRHFILRHLTDEEPRLRNKACQKMVVAGIKKDVCAKMVEWKRPRLTVAYFKFYIDMLLWNTYTTCRKPHPFEFQRGDEKTKGQDWRVVGETCEEYEQYLRDNNIDRSLLTNGYEKEIRMDKALEVLFNKYDRALLAL